MAPRKRAEVSPEHQARLRKAQAANEAAYADLRAAVVEALLAGASVREVAYFLEMSRNTIERWGRDGGWPSAAQSKAWAETRARNAELNRDLGIDGR